MEMETAKTVSDLIRDKQSIERLLKIAKNGDINSYFYPGTEFAKKTLEEAFESAGKKIQEKIESL